MRLLLVDDSAADAETTVLALRRFGFDFEWQRVDSIAGLTAALELTQWSAVISDDRLSAFGAGESLQIVRGRDPNVPFIVVSGADDAERAVELLHAGANDYVMKDRLLRLGPTLERELRDVHLREERSVLFDALRRSELRYRRLFEKAPIGVAVSTPAGNVVTANERFLAIFGYAREDLVGLPLWELSHPDDRRPTGLPTSGNSTRHVHRYLRKDGSIVWASVTVAAVASNDGTVEQLVWLVEDITAQRAAEEAAHAQEAEIERRAVQQAAVANLGQAALSGASMAGLFSLASAILTEQLHVEICGVLEARGDKFRIAGGTEWLLDFAELDAENATQAAYALRTSMPLIVTDLPSETRFRPSHMLLERGIVSGLTVPIFGANAEAWGVLGVQTAVQREFSTTDVDFVRAVAGVLGQAIMRDRADEELRVRARQQGAISELSRVALTSIDGETFQLASALAIDCLGLEDAAVLLLDTELTRSEAAKWTTRVPVTSAATSFGLFVARTPRGRALTDPEFDFLQALANILAEAMERERAAYALAASEQRYREVIEGASEVIFTLSMDGRFTSLNAAFEHITGWPAREWIGKPYLELVHEDDREHSRAVFRRLLEEQRSVTDELKLNTKTGSALIEVTSFPKIVHGAPAAIYGFVRDISEARRIEGERQQLTRNLQLVLESTVEGILKFDLAGHCTMYNSAAANILGRTGNGILGMPVHTLLHGGGAAPECEQCVTFDAARAGRVHSATDETFYRRDGASVPVDYSAAPVVDDGVAIGVVVSFADISERLRLEAKLEQADRLSSLGRLAATVAHEFNNVLMGISPFLEVIRRGRDAGTAVDHISRTIKRGKRITEDILRFTQPAEPVRTAIEVRPWLKNILVEARSLVPRHIAIAVGEADPSLRMHGDANQLQQIFTNLILNARDAMPDGGVLSISVSTHSPDARFAFGTVLHPERFVHFTVSDTGHGMDAETLRHIFEPLFTTKRTGTGLGLPVARQVVMRHHGELFVETEPGVGTTFHVFLPFADPRQPAAPATENPPEQTSVSWHVLLVEDDETVAAGLRSLMMLEGMEVTVAPTGEEAINILRTTTPDLVVLDVGLPDMDGTSVYHTIAATHPDLPVIFSTGHADRAHLDTILERPNVEYLLKPYDGVTLLAAMREVMKGR